MGYTIYSFNQQGISQCHPHAKKKTWLNTSGCTHGSPRSLKVKQVTMYSIPFIEMNVNVRHNQSNKL
jgi:hypothetical protein